MKILMIAPEFPPNYRGGLGRQVGELVDVLAQAHDIGVVSTGLIPASPGTTHWDASDASPALPSIGLDPLSRLNIATTSAIHQALSSHAWDLVHAHDWVIAPAVTSALNKSDIPILTTFHANNAGLLGGSESDRQRRLDWEHSIVRVSTAVSGVSKWLSDDLQGRYPDADVRHIPNGIHTADTFGHHLVSTEGLRATFVGRLVPYKGVEDLLRAWSLVLESHPNAQLDIVGDGFQKDDLIQTAEALAIEQSVNFLGWLDENGIQQALSNSSIAVFPSREEAFGLAAAEALVAGIPTLLSDIPAYRELVPPDFQGFFEIGDHQGLASRILSYKPSGEELERLSAGITEKYSWSKVAQRYEDCYRDLVHTHRQSG